MPARLRPAIPRVQSAPERRNDHRAYRHLLALLQALLGIVDRIQSTTGVRRVALESRSRMVESASSARCNRTGLRRASGYRRWPFAPRDQAAKPPAARYAQGTAFTAVAASH